MITVQHTYRCDPQTAAAKEAYKNYDALTEESLIFSRNERNFSLVGILEDLRACWYCLF
jgi:hypothetical protein